MGQPGFFDLDQRLEEISAKGDALETIKKAVAWADFRADIEAATERKPEDRKSNAGRRPYDAIQENSMGRKIVRTIGVARAGFKIGMMNLGYNFPSGSDRAGGGGACLSARRGWSLHRVAQIGLAAPCGASKRARNGLYPARPHGRTPNRN